MIARAKLIMAGVFAFILSVGLVTTTPAPVEAQVQGGLVNITVSINDVIDVDRVNIGAALQTAANVCGVAQVGIIAQQVATGGSGTCSNQQTGDFVQIAR